MNKLKEQIITEVQKNAYYPVNIENSAESCTAIAIEFAKDFAEWASDNGYWQNNDQRSAYVGLWYTNIIGFDKPLTTDQLINLYIESLK